VAARDSGKALLDAIMGEVIVTCEKIHWLIREGQRWLAPESRSVGVMSFYKRARVEYHPLGVVGGSGLRMCSPDSLQCMMHGDELGA
jgi:acyl-CoA reductase-like NAD-dependent aldehyde dehydrogenase